MIIFSIFSLFALFALYVLGKLIGLSIKVLSKLIINGILGALLLILINLFGHFVDINLDISIINSLVAGFFGLPGVVLLLLLEYGIN